jgi:hypothetical protein
MTLARLLRGADKKKIRVIKRKNFGSSVEVRRGGPLMYGKIIYPAV